MRPHRRLSRVHHDVLLLGLAVDVVAGDVTALSVISVDYAPNRTQVDVRFRPYPYPKPHNNRKEEKPHVPGQGTDWD